MHRSRGWRGLASPDFPIAGIHVSGVTLQKYRRQFIAFPEMLRHESGPVRTRVVIGITNRMRREVIPQQRSLAPRAVEAQHVDERVQPSLVIGRLG
jgi:hypothetical protein